MDSSGRLFQTQLATAAFHDPSCSASSCDRAAAHTRDRLFAALQGYCAAELAALGIQQAEEPMADSLRRLLSWLPNHLDQPLGLADLAHAACLSPRRLQELCREQFGCRPMELLRRHRLEAMHAQLISPAHAGESLAQLMNRWQLPDSSATRQAFLELYGNSPQKLRKQLEARWRPLAGACMPEPIKIE